MNSPSTSSGQGPLAGRSLGIVVGGSLSEGVQIKMDPAASVEEIKVGTYVSIQGERHRFFGIVTNVALGSSDPRLAATPPDVSNPFIAQVVSGTAAYGTLSVLPTLTLPQVAGTKGSIQPAKTVPAHFSRASGASKADIDLVFGEEDERHFHIGSPLDMEEKLCLNLEELVKRSNGIFGKSGTGKSFLTRLLLIGILQSRVAATLVFDMHSEYGWKAPDPERRREVKGLKQLFPSRVAVFTLDEESSLRRGIHPDVIVRIGYDQVKPEDVELLAQTLRLTPNAVQFVSRLPRVLGKDWLQTFLALETEEAAVEMMKGQEHESTIGALWRRLQRLREFPFLTSGGGEDPLRRILEYLDRGTHVVLEFGRYGRHLEAYVLVANLLTRRIHERYVRRTEEATGHGGTPPDPLVIVIEEAHRYLGPEVASQTIFGTIAREMRKYSVTLLVIDQRPGGIDSEVMSQLGTKITCLLDDERDVEAVLAGTSGSRELRSILSRLESRQQALIFGHAVPIPVVVRVRDYGTEESYRALAGQRAEARKRKPGVREEDELFG